MNVDDLYHINFTFCDLNKANYDDDEESDHFDSGEEVLHLGDVFDVSSIDYEYRS